MPFSWDEEELPQLLSDDEIERMRSLMREENEQIK